MKNPWIAFGTTLLAALLLEVVGWWWAMPIAGLIAGLRLASPKKGFLFGGLGVLLAWLLFIAFYATTSPLGELLAVFSGILGLGASLSFVPVLLASILAFLMGGLGGLTGGFAAQARLQPQGTA